MITHSAKDARQQKEWELSWTKFEKKGVGNIGEI